ncbi:MAG: hypothetical protein IKH57_09830 [Clostridia bacterium]|nr:hypothetical protein [Clostridia bacterium]
MKGNDTGTSELPEKRRGYSPAETALVRMEAVSAIVDAQTKLLERAPVKTDLNDMAAVQRVVNTYMQECARLGCIPNFEGAAAALGYSRRGLYDRIERYPDSDVAAFLDRVRTAWASMRQMAADRGAVDTTMSIFVLLNSSMGFTNQHSVELTQHDNPFDRTSMDDEVLARKYLAGAVKTDEN